MACTVHHRAVRPSPRDRDRFDLAILAAQSSDDEMANKSYIVTTNWTAIIVTALLVVAILVALVLVGRRVRSRGAR